MSRLDFQITQEPMESVKQLRERLHAGGPVLLRGDVGTGRTTAALKAIHDAPVYLSFGSRSDRSPHALVHAARQLGRPEILGTFARNGLGAALEALDVAVGERPVVADDADALFAASLSLKRQTWVDDVPGMLLPADRAWWDWLTRRAVPTILVTRRFSVEPDIEIVEHTGPKRWPVTLKYADEGWRNWPDLARRLGKRADALYFARVVAPMMSADELNALVDDSTTDLLLELGRVFRSRGGSRVIALDLAAALEGAPAGLVRRALANASQRRESDPLAWMEDQDRLFDGILKTGLISTHGDQVSVSTAVRESGAVHALMPQRASAIARRLVTAINDLGSLQPDDALAVLTAHRLAVSAGDAALAIQTARLHGQGLIELASELSRAEEFVEAWTLYGHVLTMLDHPPASNDPMLCRARSYALNYHAWNGRQCGRMDDALALEEVQRAVSLWPENARWQGHGIALLIRLGRTSDALRALEQAEKEVADHPQRARHLRVIPALESLHVGQIRVGLELLRLDTPPRGWEDDDYAVERVRSALTRLENGIEIGDITSPLSRLVFPTPLVFRLALAQRTRRWTAQIDRPFALHSGESAREAIDGLVDRLAAELLRLVGTPTPWLSDVEADRKSALIAAIDVLESDFGLETPRERWLVGRIEEDTLVIMDPRLGDRVPILPSALPDVERPSSGLWFGRVSVDRAGQPVESISELQPAGSGRSLEEIRKVLSERWGDPA